ncbi:DUF7694 domain-containing protein [Pedobacter africanus]|uniref:DUF7694 domain-containing protein n=1 Tax=Pedobacter africanus TaxID=151894 RepID=A0A1W1ZC67_9SPHI|nr:hypothetical protein [Pedobacter africanus]SMC45926.1 hypothetical protein SAMN04488524_0580 [Pedobacter africanus]
MNKVDKLRQKEANKLFKFNVTPFVEIDLSNKEHPSWMTRCFRNNRFTVMINDACKMTGGHIAIRAMVQKHDALPIHNHWSEMQNIKNKIFGEETMAIEYYPSQSELTDQANVYWMFIFKQGVIPTII